MSQPVTGGSSAVCISIADYSACITEREELRAKLHALQLVCGTSDANKFETWADRANARAERAEAELAAATARIAEVETGHRDLLGTMRVIAGMWIADTTPLTPTDALAERMAKLALAATLRRTP